MSTNITVKDKANVDLPLVFPAPTGEVLTEGCAAKIDTTALNAAIQEILTLNYKTSELSDDLNCGLLTAKDGELSAFNRALGFSADSTHVLTDPPAGFERAAIFRKLTTSIGEGTTRREASLGIAGLVTLLSVLNIAGSSWSLEQVKRKIFWQNSYDLLKGTVVAARYCMSICLLSSLTGQRLTAGEVSSDQARIVGWLQSASLFQTYSLLTNGNETVYRSLSAILPQALKVYSSLKGGSTVSEFAGRLPLAVAHIKAIKDEKSQEIVQLLAEDDKPFDMDFMEGSSRMRTIAEKGGDVASLRRHVSDISAVATARDPISYITERSPKLDHYYQVRSLRNIVVKVKQTATIIESITTAGGKKGGMRRG